MNTRGHITRRGRNSWRVKFELEAHGSVGRQTRYVTVRGTKKQAQAELARLLAAQDAGTLVEPSKVTVAEYMQSWIATASTLALSPKTAERYRQLIDNQIMHFAAAEAQAGSYR
jgi:integrase